MGQFLHDGKFGCFASYFLKKYSAGQRWSTSVGFFAICLVAQGDHKLANYDDDDGDGDDDSDDDDDDGDDDDYDDHHHHRQHHQP